MSGSVFTPNLKSVSTELEGSAETKSVKLDVVGGLLLNIAQYAMLTIFGFVTIFFTPGIWASLGFDKTIFAIVLCGIVLISMSLLALRSRNAQTVLPVSLGIFWGVVGVAWLSALLSGDIQDSIVGSVFGPQSAGFLTVMALVMTSTLVLQRSKIMTIKALAVFGCVSGLLLAYNVLRIIFGADFLPFGSFMEVTVSPIGGFNDLALFAGLVVVLGLITLLQLPLRGLTQGAVALLVYLGLFVLAVVNFFIIWVVIGFFGLLLFVYLLSKDTLFFDNTEEEKLPLSKALLVTTAIVCVVSAVFIVSGEYAGNKISSLTDIEYIEVRPSIEATIDITKAVYSENILFGIGPNRFSDAWRLHKNTSINETIFWDTDFAAGSGYIPTLFVTLGALGGTLLVVFHLLFIRLGYRMFLKNGIRDSYWYYFGILSFTGAVFLWGMSYVYVPGVSILLLAALFTGFTFVAYGASSTSALLTIPLASSRQRGFFLMAASIVVITASIGALLMIAQQYTAQASFSETQARTASAEELAQAAFASFELFPDDRFVSARAQIQLATLNAIVSIAEPTEEDQQRFIAAAEQAGIFAQQAVQADPTNPDNHAILAGLYSTLAQAGFEGAVERATTSLDMAQQLDPFNPSYKILAAQIAIRSGDVEQARAEIAASLALKRNYTQALYLSAQLDISQGNVESAISTTQAIIALEPNNPTRYFQLGVLLSANEQPPQAIAAFQAAIARDAEYANARYFLALTYVNNLQTDLALEQLDIVQQTNQDNTELAALIEQIKSGEIVAIPNSSTAAPVNDLAVPSGANTTVLNGENLDSDLVTPVNTVPVSNNSDDVQTQSDSPTELNAATATSAAPTQ
jgi:tetratricopeptide (TPR) repeat protein